MHHGNYNTEYSIFNSLSNLETCRMERFKCRQPLTFLSSRGPQYGKKRKRYVTLFAELHLIKLTCCVKDELTVLANRTSNWANSLEVWLYEEHIDWYIVYITRLHLQHCIDFHRQLFFRSFNSSWSSICCPFACNHHTDQSFFNFEPSFVHKCTIFLIKIIASTISEMNFQRIIGETRSFHAATASPGLGWFWE